MAKNSIYTKREDRYKPDAAITCYALRSADFKEYKKNGWCGTTKCPFFKKERDDTR